MTLNTFSYGQDMMHEA